MFCSHASKFAYICCLSYVFEKKNKAVLLLHAIHFWNVYFFWTAELQYLPSISESTFICMTLNHKQRHLKVLWTIKRTTNWVHAFSWCLSWGHLTNNCCFALPPSKDDGLCEHQLGRYYNQPHDKHMKTLQQSPVANLWGNGINVVKINCLMGSLKEKHSKIYDLSLTLRSSQIIFFPWLLFRDKIFSFKSIWFFKYTT